MINCDLVNALRAQGVKSSDILLVHSSLKALGYIEGGADSVIDSLIACIGEEGTLLIPALSYDNVCAPDYYFDLLNTPVCIGKIPETFRKREGVIRSIHPTHSVCAYGKLAKELTEYHSQSFTPAGRLSPFSLLRGKNAKLLMLGCTLSPNTSFHAIEEEAGVDYVLSSDEREYTLSCPDLPPVKRAYRYHYIEENGFYQNYKRIAELMDIVEFKVLEATSFLLDVDQMWEKALAALKNDPLFFVKSMKR